MYTHGDFEFIDAHVHLFPPKIFQAIWNYFERPEKGVVKGWPIHYKLSPEQLISVLWSKNVKNYTIYNYAHKQGVAEYINNWTHECAMAHEEAIPFGCVWPDDHDKEEYVSKMFDEYNFYGIKLQLLVQNFFPLDERMLRIYDLIVDKGKWICFHVGTAPYRNQYVGYKYFVPFLEKYPNVQVIVAHLGAFEYKKFLNLLDKYANLYLDTAMIYIPDNIFPERKLQRPTPEELISYQDRILYGSDFPNIPYHYEFSTEGLLKLDLPRGFYENIFFKNAKRIFGLS